MPVAFVASEVELRAKDVALNGILVAIDASRPRRAKRTMRRRDIAAKRWMVHCGGVACAEMEICITTERRKMQDSSRESSDENEFLCTSVTSLC